VVLKRLEDAIADGDPIQSIIIGSAVNQDGRTLGITHPNGEAQMDVMRLACARAGVKPADVRYIEAHGTGTATGDTIEARSIGTVYRIEQDSEEILLVGSCKTNIGHAESAAGIAGLIKTVLCLKHKTIVPNLHFHTANPNIPFDRLRLRVPTQLEPLPALDKPTIAGVNSFGFGGANAHVLVQAYENEANHQKNEIAPEAFLLPLSAKSEESLRELAGQYAEIVSNKKDEDKLWLYNLCYSAGDRRAHHDIRVPFVFNSRTQGVQQLLDLAEKIPIERPRRQASRKKLAWVFSGLGNQWYRVGLDLMEKEPVFQKEMIRCDKIYEQLAGLSILEVLRSGSANKLIEQELLCHPLNFAVQISLAKLWRHWGAIPDAIVGHSGGELAAFYEAGVYSFEETLRVIYHRCQYLKPFLGTGGMLGVGLNKEKAESSLADLMESLSVAAVNSPEWVVLSGPMDALQAVANELGKQKILHHFLPVKIAYHHPSLLNAREPSGIDIQNVFPRSPETPLYSTVTGQRFEAVDGAGYWMRNLVEPIRFDTIIQQLVRESAYCFLEIAQHPSLSPHISRSISKKDRAVFASLHKDIPERESLLTNAGKLYQSGFDLNWNNIYPSGEIVKIPTYPWNKKSYWQEPSHSLQKRTRKKDAPLLGEPVESTLTTWESEITYEKFPFLQDHKILGKIVFPGAAYAEMVFRAVRHKFESAHFVIEALTFHQLLQLKPKFAFFLQFHLDTITMTFKIYATEKLYPKNFKLVATGKVRSIPPGGLGQRESLDTALERCVSQTTTKEEIYNALKGIKFEYGLAFQGIEKANVGENEIVCEVTLPELGDREETYVFHPARLDACFQALLVLKIARQSESSALSGFQIPTNVGRIRLTGSLTGKLFVHGVLVEEIDRGARGNLFIYNDRRELVAEITGFATQKLKLTPNQVTRKNLPHYLYYPEWQKKHLNKTSSPKTEEPTCSHQKGLWAIFADEDGFGCLVAKSLKERGYNSVLFYRKNSEENLPKFVDFLEKQNPNNLTGVIHLWSLDLETSPKSIPSNFKLACCHSLVWIAQAMARFGTGGKLWLVTKDAQAVAPGKAISAPFQSSVWGLGRVIGQRELPKLWGGAIDLDAVSGDTAELAVDELLHSDGEDQVAFRQGDRFVLRLLPESSVPQEPPPLKFRDDGAYIVTGAFGEIGREVTSWMVSKGARRLILIGRNPFPERNQWSRLNGDRSLHSKLKFIQKLEKAGASVDLAQVDLTQPEQIVDFYLQYKSTYKVPVSGIIYCAGMSQDMLISKTDLDIFDRVLETKVVGAWHLHLAFSEEPIEHFILFSSIASLITNPGMGAYAAANCFLDALAHYRRAQGLSATSINWGPWKIGMAKENSNLKTLMDQMGLFGLESREGIQLFEAIANQSYPQVVVLRVDWNKLLQTQLQESPLIEVLMEGLTSDASFQGDTEFRDGNASVEDCKTEVEVDIDRYLLDTVSDLLGMPKDRISPDTSLEALGLDSIATISIVHAVYQKYRVSLNQIGGLEELSINKLAELILLKLVSIA